MQKIISLLAVFIITPALAWATTCHEGSYQGKIWSIQPEINKKPATLIIQKRGNDCVMNFEAEGSTEEWTLQDKYLIQKEYNAKGDVTTTYKALQVGDKYLINCKNRAKNICDAGIDYRNYWVLKATPNKFTYTVYGVDEKKKSDPNAPIVKRHEFKFKKQ